MNKLTHFNYGGLSPETVGTVQAATERIRVRMKRTAEDIIDIGHDLIQVKGALPHGKFGEWLQDEFEMTDRAALRFMQVAEKFGGKSDKMSDFKPTVLYLLAAPSTPEPVVNQAMEKSKTGEQVSIADLKEWKRRAMAAEKKERATTESLLEIQQERNSLRTHVQDLENRDPLVIEMEKESSTTPFPILPMAMLFTLLDEMETGLKSSQRVGINNDELNAVRNRILRMVATIEEALTAMNQPFSQWGE